MSNKQIVFLGSKAIGAYCLKHLLKNQDLYNINIVAVSSKGNVSLDEIETVSSLATKYNIKELSSAGEIPDCDIIISVQHHEILKQRDINKAKEIALNLHMAPLPEYRGCNQFSFAIIDKKKEFGVTLHKMTTGIDNGAIIAERRFAIDSKIWIEDLYNQTVEESKKLFSEEIGSIISGTYDLIPQETLVEERGTSYHYRNEITSIKVIDESWSEEKKKLYVRATYKQGFEPPYSIVNGVKKYYDKDSF